MIFTPRFFCGVVSLYALLTCVSVCPGLVAIDLPELAENVFWSVLPPEKNPARPPAVRQDGTHF